MTAKSIENTAVKNLSIKKQVFFASTIVIGFFLLGETRQLRAASSEPGRY
jgi:hypothetical protein